MSSLQAWQRTLAAEHAAVYLYGALGARTSAADQPRLLTEITAAYATHRARRDQVTRTIRDLGGSPDPAAVAYELPTGVGTPQGVRRASGDIEASCATTYAWTVANTATEARRAAVGMLHDAAVRGLAFGGTPEMFPGAGEFTDRSGPA